MKHMYLQSDKINYRLCKAIIYNYKFKIMEILNSFYQQRIQSVTKSFLFLLQQLQKTMTPFSDIQLSTHKIQYLEHIITTTLNHERETFIQDLFKQIETLKNQLDQSNTTFYENGALGIKQYSKNSTCSRVSSIENKQVRAKKTRRGYLNPSHLVSYKQNSENVDLEFNSQSSISSWNSRKQSKHQNLCYSQSTIKLDRHLSANNQYENQDSLFQFKYLKINKY